MYAIAPTSGLNVFAASAVFSRAVIWSRVAPDSASAVSMSSSGSTERTAGGLRHTGERIFGFHSSGSSTGLCHDQSTRQTKPFLPSTAVS